MPEDGLRDVSDTALFVAFHRALESERTDALFHDPYARSLAGERGERAARGMLFGLAGWPVVPRTVVFDELILRAVRSGAIDMVVNLAAGLDTRPYRLDLPSGLDWVEADLPGILDYKTASLRDEPSRCRLERVAADLTDAAATGKLLDLTTGRRALVLTEGLLVYLTAADVTAIAKSLHERPGVRSWVLDLAGQAAVGLSARGTVGRQLSRANAAHRFAPREGPGFFRPLGWEPTEVHSAWEVARRLGRLPWPLRAMEAVTMPGQRGRYREINRLMLLARSDATQP